MRTRSQQKGVGVVQSSLHCTEVGGLVECATQIAPRSHGQVCDM